MKKLCLALCALMIGMPGFAAVDSLDIKIGQMIMIGIGDRKKVSNQDQLLEELRAGKIGGIVLFEKNIDSATAAASLKDMIGQCRAAAPIPLWVSIDEEGGKVHRLKEKYGFVGMPSAAYLGQLNQLDSTRYYSARLATELKDLGFNMNYAPDVDVAVNPDNTVIVGKNRSYSAIPEVVSQQAMACIQAQSPLGITNILKHFPGHGSSAGDSHLGIVDVSDTWKFSELIPYAQLLEAQQCNAIMTAHIINSHWDNSMLPATLSKATIQGILRGLLKFDGVVFSDDMQMGAISKNYGFAKAVTLSINAGVDVLMFANNVGKDVPPVTATEVHALIRKLVRKHKISRKRIDEAYVRICKLKGLSA